MPSKSQVKGYWLNVPNGEDREGVVTDLRASGRWMVLDTCQRLEIYGMGEAGADFADDRVEVLEVWPRLQALERLARIATGLESRVLGELEVMGQVRSAYKLFRGATGGGLKELDKQFQDVIALARRARRESGIDQKLTGLSGLAARTVLDRIEPGAPLAVVGSGTLAGSVLRYFNKRGSSPLRVAGRCPDKAMSLALTAGGFGSSLDQLAHLLDDVAGIVTATAAPHPIVYAHHLKTVRPGLVIVDLGVPADCCPSLVGLPGTTYFGLEAIEAMSESNQLDREAAAVTANAMIRTAIERWA